MINNFDIFLNEAKRFPNYKVGDYVIIKDYHEFKFKRGKDHVWDNYEKLINYADLGCLLKIADIDNEKKMYICEFVEGVIRISYKRGSSYRAKERYISPNERNTHDNTPYYLAIKEKEFTTEGVDTILRLLKGHELIKSRDKVSVSGTEKSLTREMIGVAVSKSISSNKLHYRIDGISNSVSEDSIEIEHTMDDTAIELLAKEISSKLNVDIEEVENNRFIYDVYEVNLNGITNGKIYFRSADDRKEFFEKFQKFLEENSDKQLQKVMKEGEESKLSVKAETGTGRWYMANIPKEKIAQAARTIGINVKEFLDRKKGTIAGRKYGL